MNQSIILFGKRVHDTADGKYIVELQLSDDYKQMYMDHNAEFLYRLDQALKPYGYDAISTYQPASLKYYAYIKKI